MLNFQGNLLHKWNNNHLYIYQINQNIGDICGVSLKKKKNINKLSLDAYFLEDTYLVVIDKYGNLKPVKKFKAGNKVNSILKLTLDDNHHSVGLVNQVKSKREIKNSMIIKNFDFYIETIPKQMLNIKPYQLSISKVYFINLEHRLNRRRSIEKELYKMHIPANQIVYIKAVNMPYNPQIGCALSHMKALADARKNNYEDILILEDDFKFNCNRDNLNDLLYNTKSYITDWDVIMLSSINYKSYPTQYKGLNKVIKADTTAGYIVNKKALIPIFNIFLNCTQPKLNFVANQNAIDVAWQILQPKMNWFITQPLIGKQDETFMSDIEKYRTSTNLALF